MAFDPYAPPPDNSGWGTAPGPAYAQYPPPPTGQYPAPYGQAPYGYGPAAVGSPNPLAGLGTAVSVALGVLCLLEVLQFVTRLNQTDVLYKLRSDPLSVSLTKATQADHLVALTSGLWLLAWIPTVVLFLVWLYRARKNVEFFAPRFQRLSPGWAIGGWFIPFANLVLPYRVVSDVALDSRPERPERRHTTRLVLGWWLCWLAGNVISALAVLTHRQPVGGPVDIGVLIGRNQDYLAGNAVMAVAAVLGVLVVRSITRDQNTRLTVPAPAYPRY
jgi:hypothetical protein